MNCLAPVATVCSRSQYACRRTKCSRRVVGVPGGCRQSGLAKGPLLNSTSCVAKKTGQAHCRHALCLDAHGIAGSRQMDHHDLEATSWRNRVDAESTASDPALSTKPGSSNEQRGDRPVSGYLEPGNRSATRRPGRYSARRPISRV